MIDYETILAAKHGNAEAMAEVMKHYSPYIRFRSKRSYYDCFGNRKEYVDTDIQDQIESKLMRQIIFKFNIEKTP